MSNPAFWSALGLLVIGGMSWGAVLRKRVLYRTRLGQKFVVWRWLRQDKSVRHVNK